MVINARDRLRAQFGLSSRVRVGVAGGIGCPEAASAAFAFGAAFVCTGTINQMAKQAGVCDDVRLALSRATYTDVAVCPADITSSTKLQVLKKGTMFPARARKLHDLSVRYVSIDQIPAVELTKLEKDLFKQSINEVWAETKAHYLKRLRNPLKLAQAESDPRVKFELIYHWYLVRAFGWTLQGDARRKLDYHVWCSPAIGAFNSFIKGSFLEPAGGGYPCVFQLNLHLLLGACHLMRLRMLGSAGVPVGDVVPYRPSGPL
jgi:PfaD family protein